MTIHKNKAGTVLFFSEQESFTCIQCPAQYPDPSIKVQGSFGITLTCAAEWCPVFAWFLEEAEEYEDPS